MLTNKKYIKLYTRTGESSVFKKYKAADEELADFIVNRLIRKTKEGVEKMIESEHLQNRTYALEILLDKKTLVDYMYEVFTDEQYGYDYDLPIRAAKESSNTEITDSAELFTKEYIDTFDADGELLMKAMDGVINCVINCVIEALKKKAAIIDGVE